MVELLEEMSPFEHRVIYVIQLLIQIHYTIVIKRWKLIGEGGVGDLGGGG